MRPIVAFQGETGAFSEAAAEQLVPGPLTLFPCATFDALMARTNFGGLLELITGEGVD